MKTIEEINSFAQDICNRAESVKCSVDNVCQQISNVTEPDVQNLHSSINTMCLTAQTSYTLNSGQITFTDDRSTFTITSNGMFLNSDNLTLNNTDWESIVQRINDLESRLDAIGA